MPEWGIFVSHSCQVGHKYKKGLIPGVGEVTLWIAMMINEIEEFTCESTDLKLKAQALFKTRKSEITEIRRQSSPASEVRFRQAVNNFQVEFVLIKP